VRRSKRGPERIQTQTTTILIMSQHLEIFGDESQEGGLPPSRFLLSGSTFNAPVTINTGPDFSYTNYGQHVESRGKINNYYGGK
jgi:hypothetical protein